MVRALQQASPHANILRLRVVEMMVIAIFVSETKLTVKKRSFRGGFGAKATAKRSTRSLVAVEVSARLTHVSAGKGRTPESRIGFELSFASSMTYTNESAKYYQESN